MKRFPIYIAIILSFVGCRSENAGVMLDECSSDNVLVFWPNNNEDLYKEWEKQCQNSDDLQECMEDNFLNYLDEGQYYQEKQDSECRHRRCIDGKWVKDSTYECQYSCLSPEDIIIPPPQPLRCGDCLNGQMICADDGIRICKDGRWSSSINCNGNSCRFKSSPSETSSGNYECGECKNGDETIIDVNNICTKRICKNGTWVIDDTFASCQNSCYVAEDGTAKCGGCLNNKTKCESSSDLTQLYQCQNGQWNPIKFCSESDSVNANGTAQASCTKSNDGSYACGVCLNDDHFYKNNKQNICEHKICMNGQWVLDEDFKETCQFSCNDSFTGCGDCVNGTGNCENNTVHNCIDGNWNIAETSCGDVSCVARVTTHSQTSPCTGDNCDCADGSCDPDDPCADGSCDPDDPCADGSCDPDAPCADGSCDPDDDDEDHHDDPVSPHAPDAPSDEPTDPEDNDSDEDESTETVQTIIYQCGECFNGKVEIFNDQATQQCIKRTCNDGRWDIEKPCSENSCIITDESAVDYVCGDCVNNQYSCADSTTQMICQNGKTIEHTKCNKCTESGCYKQCATPNTCTNDEATQVGMICNPDYTTSPCIGVSCSQTTCGKCLNNQIEYREANNICSKYTCKDAQWAPTTCPNNASCTQSNSTYTGCGQCTNDRISYSMTSNVCYYKKCSAGTWGTPTKCYNGVSCKGSSSNYTGCGECVNGDTRFTNLSNICYYSKCASGIWGDYAKCSNGNSCAVTSGKYSGCGSCVNAKVTYTQSGNTCYYQTCANGAWGASSKCTGGYSCKKSGSSYTGCGECENGKTKCTSGTKYTCSAGLWGSKKSCTQGCNSAGTDCK